MFDSFTPLLTVNLDQGTPLIVDDDSYFKKLVTKDGILPVDESLWFSSSTNGIVKSLADGTMDFISLLPAALNKKANLQVLTGNKGGIRKVCSALAYYVKQTGGGSPPPRSHPPPSHTPPSHPPPSHPPPPHSPPSHPPPSHPPPPHSPPSHPSPSHPPPSHQPPSHPPPSHPNKGKMPHKPRTWELPHWKKPDGKHD